MNYSPPYYGTWTKKAKNVGPRTPFKTDAVQSSNHSYCEITTELLI